MKDYFDEILKLEFEIKKCNYSLTCAAKPDAITKTIQHGLTEENLNNSIKLMNKYIKQNKNSIQHILEAHPEVEPLYILYLITK